MSSDQRSFEIFSTLPPNLQPPADEVVKFISPHVKESGDGVKSFDWPSFKEALDNYPGVDIVIEGFKSPETSKNPFNNLPSVCARELIDPLSMPLPKEDITQFMKGVLNDLKSAKESGRADFKLISPGDPGKKPPVLAVTGWEIRVLLLSESRSRSSDFPALVGTIQLAGELDKEEDWYRLGEDSTKEVALDITTMKLGVSPEFQAP
ncbi:hypothetical protein RSOLAG22IIIB_07600 [Rhizoctonia solani]|uniref:Uncharacterized protein n=1 Tax=Rhizoctonia solani TaxID=456999 RepID=A0A0K6FP95_9AGAM|nr:hypothetical protein RSOLAG22IIIB_07600 [Rhizoctonia solani]